MLFHLRFHPYSVSLAISKNKVIYWTSRSIFDLCRYKSFYHFNRSNHAIRGHDIFPESRRINSDIFKMPFLSHASMMKILRKRKSYEVSLLTELFEYGFYLKENGFDLVVCSGNEPYAQSFCAWLSNHNLRLYERTFLPNILSRPQPILPKPTLRQPIHFEFSGHPPLKPVPEFILPDDPPEVALSQQQCSLAAAKLEKLVAYQDHPQMMPLDLSVSKPVSSSSLLWQLLTKPIE